MVQDYHYINAWTVYNAYSLLLISDLIDHLQGAKFFTKLNLRNSYNNLQILK